MKFIIEILNRFKEPSSWAVIFTTIAGVGITLDAGIVQNLTMIGAGLAGIAGFFLSEKKK